MKPIILVDPKVDKAIDKHFSKRKAKTSKLINPEKLYEKMIAEAQDHHEQFMPKKAKSYKAGFDNGWAMGYYEGLCKAAKVIMNHKPVPRKPRIKDEDRRTLTGKELRVAAEKHLPVYYIETNPNPADSFMNFHDKDFLEKALVGYYIGNSDINPDEFEDDQEVSGEDVDGVTYRVCAIEGINYGCL
jgi:hypothetical protein